ncbi:integral membrane protein (TIGR01906 family) [Clostridium pascui]|uniref:TIGR01906 family membrane protein n=1 Tax=Clostridium pascui TaxID=46609 RepID=UPI0019567F69|nr:TIGR01906 family membrane protein [Clostridium pascui]MBM7869147.1 integral membrane protein (TIGR01906 family) [Clostridium pascui]
MYSPVYTHQIETRKKRTYKLFQILFSLTFSLFIIASAVKFTLMFKPLYYFDIQHLNIVDHSNFSKDEIVKNYDYVIDYLLSSKKQDFKLPSIPYSKYGQIHFKDVKRIFTSIDILLIITGLISAIGLLITLKHKKFDFLKQTSSILIILPIVLVTAFLINFDAAFTIFHKIFFRNDYWIFDPDLDPIIKILPEEFFFHSALLIVIVIILSIIVLKLLYSKFSKLTY